MSKKTIFALALSTLAVGTVLTSCSTPAEKVEEKQEKLEDAKEDLKEADKAYLEDVKKFRTAQTERMAVNDKSLEDFKSRIDTEKKEAREEYIKKIADLEKKNSDLKLKMENYNESGKQNWEKFKMDFNHEVEMLGKAFTDFGTKKTTKK